MLKLLRINNIALVSQVELELGSGLTLLTGETGAGKSILMDSLGLLLGGRASSDLVRSGESQAVVEAIIEVPGVGDWLAAHGLPDEGGEVIVRRELPATGRGRVTINGALAPVALLRELAPRIAALHGQHEPQGLLDPAGHVRLLDRHGHVAAEPVAELYRQLRQAEVRLEQLRENRQRLELRRETLLFQLNEVDGAQLQAGEDERLERDKQIQGNADRVVALCSEAYEALYEDEDAVLSRLGQAFRSVETLAGMDRDFAPFVEAANGVRAQIEELALFLRDYRARVEANPARLNEIETRLALIERFKRKYREDSTAALLMRRGVWEEELEGLDAPEEQERRLTEEVEHAAQCYLKAALRLSHERRETARDLEQRVEAELALLAMERTRFRVRFQPEELLSGEAQSLAADRTRWSESGLDRAEFHLSPNPGEELRPLARVASGGELSRILLGLNAASDIESRPRTLVFDEVDSGIGGRVAEVVGRKLRALATRHQVLCVTHLPQIAAQADRHLLVRKEVVHGRTLTRVSVLSAQERVGEIARMLGGERITEAARAHAREMLRPDGRV